MSDPKEELRWLRVWAARVLADATPDADGAVGFTSDSEVRAAQAFAAFDRWLTRAVFTVAADEA